MQPSLIIVGLGNPGKQYEETRHNTGFRAVDALAEEYGTATWKDAQKFSAHTMEARVVTAPVLLVKPVTFMNRSGEAVKKLLDFYHGEPGAVLVLCDDVDLAPGVLRLRKSGGPGTHNGLKSIVEHIGENFPRIRIGIGVPVRRSVSEGGQEPDEDLSAYVLSRPPADDRKKIAEAVAKVPGMTREFVMGGKE